MTEAIKSQEVLSAREQAIQAVLEMTTEAVDNTKDILTSLLNYNEENSPYCSTNDLEKLTQELNSFREELVNYLSGKRHDLISSANSTVAQMKKINSGISDKLQSQASESLPPARLITELTGTIYKSIITAIKQRNVSELRLGGRGKQELQKLIREYVTEVGLDDLAEQMHGNDGLGKHNISEIISPNLTVAIKNWYSTTPIGFMRRRRTLPEDTKIGLLIEEALKKSSIPAALVFDFSSYRHKHVKDQEAAKYISNLRASFDNLSIIIESVVEDPGVIGKSRVKQLDPDTLFQLLQAKLAPGGDSRSKELLVHLGDARVSVVAVSDKLKILAERTATYIDTHINGRLQGFSYQLQHAFNLYASEPSLANQQELTAIQAALATTLLELKDYLDKFKTSFTYYSRESDQNNLRNDLIDPMKNTLINSQDPHFVGWFSNQNEVVRYKLQLGFSDMLSVKNVARLLTETAATLTQEQEDENQKERIMVTLKENLAKYLTEQLTIIFNNHGFADTETISTLVRDALNKIPESGAIKQMKRATQNLKYEARLFAASNLIKTMDEKFKQLFESAHQEERPRIDRLSEPAQVSEEAMKLIEKLATLIQGTEYTTGLEELFPFLKTGTAATTQSLAANVDRD